MDYNSFLIASPEQLKKFAREYYMQGDSIIKVLDKLKRHYDMKTKGLGYVIHWTYMRLVGCSLVYHINALYMIRRTKLQEYYKLWGLSSSRKQANTIESIAPFVQQIKDKFQNAGGADIHQKLHVQHGIKASK